MLNIKNIKFENNEDLYKIVDMVAKVENSPIILLSTSEDAREYFIQQLTETLLERYNKVLKCFGILSISFGEKKSNAETSRGFGGSFDLL